MNLYFLLEGASTETIFYPELVKFVFEERLTRIFKVNEVNDQGNSYFILSGDGYPQIYTHILPATLEDILQYPDFTQLFICLDADELSVAERKAEFESILNNLINDGLDISPFCEIILIIQNRCIETWFLGNKRFYKQNTTNRDLLKFNRFYNVKMNDPEDMGFDIGFDNHASYHYSYLKQMVRENRRRYSKNNPSVVCENSYIERLNNRATEDSHIQSFGYLFNKLFELNKKLTA